MRNPFPSRPGFIFCLLLVSNTLLMPGHLFSQSRNNRTDSLELAHTLTGFIQAFSNLDWERFTEYFSDSATAFFPPSARFPYRANNKLEIEGIFRKFFDAVKKTKEKPPYLDIQPKQMMFQFSGSTAIVSFMLDDPELLGRRTLVLEKINGRWQIIHLHASAAKPVETP